MAEMGSSNQLEQDIAHIERQLEEKREALREQQKEMPHDRELLHSVIQEKISPAAPQTTTPPTDDTQTTTVPPELHQKVQALVDIAFIKSIDEAISEAKATNNAALIDAFHDVLVDELYNHLIERGKLKQM